MSSSSNASKWAGAKSAIGQIRELVGSLPTNEQKAELATLLDTIIRFLTDLRANVGLLPSSEQLTDVDTALKGLEALLDKVSASRILAPAVGTKPRKVIAHSTDPGARDKAQRQLEELRALPVDDIRARLASEDTYSLADLRSIASAAHVRRTDRMPREAIAHQVAMKIANARGYEGLRGGDAPPNTPSAEAGRPTEPA